MAGLNVIIREWETVGPGTDRRLADRGLADDAARKLAERLTSLGRLEVIELARGLELRATSFVGRLQIGDLTVTINPKLTGMPLLRLLRYAYGLRQLDLYGVTNHATSALGFHELIALQLVAEVEELAKRGFLRDYVRHAEDLSSPRGRINFQRYVRTADGTRSTLPCVHYLRDEDTHLNRVVLAGLEFAATLLGDPELRGHARRLSKEIGEVVTRHRLDRTLLAIARQRMDRRTRAYESSLTLIEILLNLEGVSLDESADSVPLRGFLFDMNRFFQALLSRFLRDNLDGMELHDERTIREMFAYESNPQRRRAPRLRPDFTVMVGRRVIAVLDAKYRDLWEKPLPREMLYQLALYALARDGQTREAVILYPTLNDSASEQAVGIQRFQGSDMKPRVTMRPINLMTLDRIVSDDRHNTEERRSWAKGLVFGNANVA